MLGILVHGDNHFIVRGPLPGRACALALAREWSLIRIGQTLPAALTRWSISTREFREDLQWAVVVPNDAEMSDAVSRLIAEMRARGVRIHNAGREDWPGEGGCA